MKSLMFTAALLLIVQPAIALESIDDEQLSKTVARDGIDAKVNFKGDMNNLYFETTNNGKDYRFNMGGFTLDTNNGNGSTNTNSPISLAINGTNRFERKGLEIEISDVTSLDLFADNIGIVEVDGGVETTQIFGTLGFENVSFNGGTARLDILAIPGDGDEGLMTTFSLPDNTTGDFIVADEVAKLSASLEVNGFSMTQTVDVVDLDSGPGQDLALKMIISEMETSLDVKNLRVGAAPGSSTVVTRQGGFGQLSVDTLKINSGYTIVDSVQF